ncbi:squamous cell carcinoma antigen recognized by T-cells 3 [Bombina bombina]|uniref:squamous cell carcinoma antigen recognized by T-cells 3 n=1 Tax=Bombina bombina TaxID=8345 RepID=UPI00235A5755|nr:squamous cell carcinoma antigen recognized by T-cells 3 [Bombina bombina]
MAAECGEEERDTQTLGSDEEEMESTVESPGEGGGSSDRTGESSDEEDEKENEAEIQRLEEQLSINAFDYNCHVDLIKLLRQEGELERLRRARQKMSELFPLTEEIWLDWLKDEIKVGEEDASRDKVYELFQRAVKDYICPEIWLEYAQYSIGGMGEKDGIAQIRAIFERALTAVGLHMTKGSTVWDAYREFENAILGTIQPKPGSIPTAEQQQMFNSQLERIHTLFKRQLGVPLLDMETTYAEYEEWSDDPIPDSVTQNFRKALQQMGKYKPYEESLLAAETPKLSEYQAYIDFEMKVGDPARIQLIFERALAENCLVPDLWAKYTQYLARHCNNMQKAREIWDSIMTRGNSKFANMWLEYYNLERAHGDTQHCRKALHRAVQCTTDYPEHVCDVLLALERIEGSLEDWDTAVQKTENKLSRISEQRAKAAAKEAKLAQQEEEKADQKKKLRAEKKASKKFKKAKPGEKRKVEDEEEEEEEWGEEAGVYPENLILLLCQIDLQFIIAECSLSSCCCVV